jgi:hypothetical protein
MEVPGAGAEWADGCGSLAVVILAAEVLAASKEDTGVATAMV